MTGPRTSAEIQADRQKETPMETHGTVKNLLDAYRNSGPTTALDRLTTLPAVLAARHTPNLAEHLTQCLAAADARNTALHAYASQLEQKLGIARERVSTLERSLLAALADQANAGNMLDTIEHAADRIGRQLAGGQPSLSEVRRQYGRIAQVLADDTARALAARAALNAEATA